MILNAKNITKDTIDKLSPVDILTIGCLDVKKALDVHLDTNKIFVTNFVIVDTVFDSFIGSVSNATDYINNCISL